MSELCLITLTVPPALEATLIDWLLAIDHQAGFTSFPVHGHSSRHEGLSLAEQVAGRTRQVRFQIHLPASEWPEFLARLQRDFTGTGVHYWLSPLLAAGRL